MSFCFLTRTKQQKICEESYIICSNEKDKNDREEAKTKAIFRSVWSLRILFDFTLRKKQPITFTWRQRTKLWTYAVKRLVLMLLLLLRSRNPPSCHQSISSSLLKFKLVPSSFAKLINHPPPIHSLVSWTDYTKCSSTIRMIRYTLLSVMLPFIQLIWGRSSLSIVMLLWWQYNYIKQNCKYLIKSTFSVNGWKSSPMKKSVLGNETINHTPFQ